MSGDASVLLTNEDYVGFFKACGPTYVKAIRRAQEIVTVLSYTSYKAESDYSSRIQVSGWTGGNGSSSTQYTAESQSLNINIKAWGMGLSLDGSETLVATNFEQYTAAMTFAYNSFTKNPDAYHVGMVVGIEVAPWSVNAAFSAAMNIADITMLVPMSRAVIQKSVRIADSTDQSFDNSQRSLNRCRNEADFIDKYGYCCEDQQLYNIETQEYDESDPEIRVCRPMIRLSPEVLHDNVMLNSEFVARLDRSVRLKLNTLALLEKCVSAARAIPNRYDFHHLRAHATIKADFIVADISLFELKLAIDPFDDYSTVKHMAKELDEYVSMFISPCYNALFGAHLGPGTDTESRFFMAYPWYNWKECIRLSCLAGNSQWDRSSGDGCIASTITGANSPSYDSSNEEGCLKDNSSGEISCKHNSTELEQFHSSVTACWEGTIGSQGIDYFLGTYCLPDLLPEEHDDATINGVKESHIRHCGGTGILNVARGKPASQSSRMPHLGSTARASLVVDGDTDGYFWRGSVSCTQYQENPWWSVDLQNDYSIVEIKIFNRIDVGRTRLQDAKVQILKDGAEQWSHILSASDIVNSIPVDPPVEGDQVKITLEGKTTWLHMAEVEVNSYFS